MPMPQYNTMYQVPKLPPMMKDRRILLFTGKLEVNTEDFTATKLRYEQSLYLNVGLMRDDKRMYIIV